MELEKASLLWMYCSCQDTAESSLPHTTPRYTHPHTHAQSWSAGRGVRNSLSSCACTGAFMITRQQYLQSHVGQVLILYFNLKRFQLGRKPNV